MRICYFDAFSGMSGDMTVGALLDAGASRDGLVEALTALQLGATFEIEKTRRRGITATRFVVAGGETKAHRHLPHIAKIIDAAPIAAEVKAKAQAVFQRLGESEAAVHGVPIEMVHFHEVGAVDSICDIVGACWALHNLGVDEVYCSPINVGSGTVNTEHGLLPVPAPATASLLTGKPIYSRGPQTELTTPTGAALAVTLAKSFGPMPAIAISSIGYGCGTKDFPEQANVLRAIVGESRRVPEALTVSVIEANIDDSTPEVLGYTMERLLEAGALDVTFQPVFMKKNRPATLLRVLARPEDQEPLAQLVFAETTSLGLRIYHAERRVQPRRIDTVETPFGPVNIKVSGVAGAPEYEDCRKLAREHNVPLKNVLAAAVAAYEKSKIR
ncbi:MAG: nickel pincer cofactor biosynthesis protein LarC [Bryobacteraceae bacterium]